MNDYIFSPTERIVLSMNFLCECNHTNLTENMCVFFSWFLVQYFPREWYNNVIMRVTVYKYYKISISLSFFFWFQFSSKKSQKNPFIVYWIWKNKEAKDLLCVKKWHKKVRELQIYTWSKYLNKTQKSWEKS